MDFLVSLRHIMKKIQICILIFLLYVSGVPGTYALCPVSLTSLFSSGQNSQQDSLKHDLKIARQNTNDKTKPDFAKARESLNRAFKNPYGKDNAEVLLQAANTEYRCFQVERNKPATGKKMDEKVIYASTADGFRYYCRAYQLLRHPVAGSKQVGLNMKATQQMQSEAYDLFRSTQGFRATAGYYYNMKDWKKAYEFFKLAQEAIDCEILTHYAANNYAVQADFAKFRTDSIRRRLQFSAAVSAVHMGDHPLAIKELEAAKHFGIESNRVRQQLCKEYIAIQDTAGYERALKEGVNALPKEPWYPENLLNLYLDRRELKKALDIIDRVLSFDTSNAKIIELKGQLLEEFGDTAGAEVAYLQAVVFDTTLLVSYSSLGRICFNRALEAENALVEARQFDDIYTKAVPLYEAALPYYNKAYENDTERKDSSIATAIRTILYKRFQSPKCKNAKLLIRRYNEVSRAYGMSTL